MERGAEVSTSIVTRWEPGSHAARGDRSGRWWSANTASAVKSNDFYNTARPHSSLDKQTPDEFYFATLPAIEQAA